MANSNNVIVWNCRGATPEEFLENALELKHEFNPLIIIFLDTKSSREDCPYY